MELEVALCITSVGTTAVTQALNHINQEFRICSPCMQLMSHKISKCQTLAMTKMEEQALLIFERKIFRRIYGPKYEDGEWKSRTNQELEESSKGENIIKWIKEQRISWLGHWREWRTGCPKKSSLKNWKGRDKE